MRRTRMRMTRRAWSFAMIALLLLGLILACALIAVKNANERGAETEIVLNEEKVPLGAGLDEPPADVIPKEAERPAETEKPREPERPAETEQPKEPDRSTETEKNNETEKPAQTEEPKEIEEPAQSEKPREIEEPAQTEKPMDTEEPAQAERPMESEEPTITERPEASEEPAESEQPEPMAESPEDEDLAAEPPPELAAEEPEDAAEQGSGSIQIGSREPASAAPGEAFTLAMPIRYLYGGRTYLSNAGANGGIRAYRAGHSASDYDQSIADVLPWVRMSIATSQDEDFPLEPQMRSRQRTLIQGGANMGYAVFEGVRVREDAEPGVYPVRLSVDWTDESGDQWQRALTAYIQVEASEEAEAADEPESAGLEEEDAADADDDEFTDDESDGDCRLLGVPQRLDFGAVTLSGEPQLIGLAGAMTIEVLDTREAGGWTLRVTAGPLTGEKDTLPGTLVFVHSDGRVEPLPPGESVVIAEKPQGAEPGITGLAWPRGEGLHIRLEAHEISPGARYTASVTWLLDVTDDAAE